MHVCVYIYMYIYVERYIDIGVYIYIYIERERDGRYEAMQVEYDESKTSYEDPGRVSCCQCLTTC